MKPNHSEKKINIAIIEPVGGHGGNDIYNNNLVRSICLNENYKVVLYTCDETITKDIEFIKITFKNIYGNSNKFIRVANYIIGIFTSLFDARRNGTDIIHLHFFGFSMSNYLILFITKIFFKFYVVGTIHDVESFEKYSKVGKKNPSITKYFSFFDGVVVHTEYARKELLKVLPNVKKYSSKIRTIYACDLDYNSYLTVNIGQIQSRQILSLPLERKIILFFGQIKEVKGLEILLEAIYKLSRKDNTVLLVIAGKLWKDDFANYENIIQQLEINRFVERRIGFIKNEEVQYYFKASDVIVLPYKKNYNSGVLIRAMSFGTPVIASNIGPFNELIRDGENGFLFETENSENLALRLQNVLDQKNLMITVSNAEKEFIKEKFSLVSIGNKYRELYKSILKEKG